LRENREKEGLVIRANEMVCLDGPAVLAARLLGAEIGAITGKRGVLQLVRTP
jgi:hypothetical protein